MQELNQKVLIMDVWKLEYFEVGASNAYMTETHYGFEAKDAAVGLFSRLGGEEILRITAPCKQDRIPRWLKALWPRRPS